MSIIGSTRFQERLRFFDGQRLFASDLQGIDALNRDLRWLHNQSLHQPGIGSGLAATGAKGAREVTVQPGYAIDAHGREIVLTSSTVAVVPPVADDGFGGPVYFDLTVAYPDEAALKESETRDGLCGAPRGAIRLREAPVFCWARLGPPPERLPVEARLLEALRTGERLRVARAQVLNCQLDRPLSLAVRHNARPAELPYAACGRATAPSWRLPNGFAPSGAGLQLVTTVGTTSAAFRTPPCYAVELLGHRVFTFSVNGLQVQRVLDGFSSVMAPTAAAFDYGLLIPDALFATAIEDPTNPDPRLAADFDGQLMAQLAANAWQVDWIGVEG